MTSKAVHVQISIQLLFGQHVLLLLLLLLLIIVIIISIVLKINLVMSLKHKIYYHNFRF